jgi:hypothetical protein
MVTSSSASRCALTVLLAVGAISCKKIDRPRSLPATAVLVGTAQHYEFIDCSTPTSPPYLDCTVYNGSGAVLAKGYYTPSFAGPFDPRDPKEYLAFDGHQIRLTHDRRLELREPPRPPSVPPTASWGDNPLCGTYVDCKSAADQRYTCTVYQERSGAVVTSGTFLLQGETVARPRALCDVVSSGRIVVDGGYLQRTP